MTQTAVPTVFSRIIAGELPCAKVYEDEHVFAFMDAGQVNPGHVLVVSKQPFETLLDADEETAAALMRAALLDVGPAADACMASLARLEGAAEARAGWETVRTKVQVGRGVGAQFASWTGATDGAAKPELAAGQRQSTRGD